VIAVLNGATNLNWSPKLASLELIATCPDSCKQYVADELAELGAKEIDIRYAAVAFKCSEANFYRIHLKCRTASRLLLVIKEFAARTPEMLFDQARRIPWTKTFDPKYSFIVEGVQTNRGPEHMKSNEISKRIREALQSSFERAEMTKPKVDLKEPQVTIVGHVLGGRCTVCIDTSGKSLHKRGFRLDGHPAPMKETLAAILLRIVKYDGSQVLLDPMCGSGTIPIEAAYMALHKAPLIHRKKGDFGFEWIKMFNKDMWREIQDEVRAERAELPPKPIFARDISDEFVDMARNHAKRARVDREITLECDSFFDVDAPASEGILLSNLPYGERLKSRENEMIDFYKKIGDTLKHKYKGWTAALLVAEESPFKFIGLKPKRKIALLNGSIPVKLLIFEIY
jgi:putative N6-adenine-specific DNA methylase